MAQLRASVRRFLTYFTERRDLLECPFSPCSESTSREVGSKQAWCMGSAQHNANWGNTSGTYAFTPPLVVRPSRNEASRNEVDSVEGRRERTKASESHTRASAGLALATTNRAPGSARREPGHPSSAPQPQRR